MRAYTDTTSYVQVRFMVGDTSSLSISGLAGRQVIPSSGTHPWLFNDSAVIGARPVRQYRERSAAADMMRADTAAPRISHIGLVARSPEGHAARTMQIKGHEDQWVDIQANTFKNWVNEHVSPSNRVQDLAEDLKDGRVLCELVENLQKKKIPAWSRSPGNRHQMLENVSKALAAIADDGVKLVNIGKR